VGGVERQRKEVDEFARAMQAMQKAIIDANVALDSFASPEKLTATEKAFAELTGSERWKKLTDAQQLSVAAQARIAITAEQAHEAQKRLFDDTLKALHQEAEAESQASKAREKAAEEIQRIRDSTIDYVASLQSQADRQQFSLSLIGQTEEAQARLTAQYDLSAKARERQAVIEREIRDLQTKTNVEGDPFGLNADKVAALRAEYDEIGTSTARIAPAIGEAAAQTVVANREAQTWKSTFESINSTLVDAFLKAFEDIRQRGAIAARRR
jgi:hypothetical protein